MFWYVYFQYFFCNFLFSFVKWRFNGEGKGRHNWGETTGDHNRGKQTYNKHVKWLKKTPFVTKIIKGQTL